MAEVILLCSSWSFSIKKKKNQKPAIFSKFPCFCLFTESEAGWGWRDLCKSCCLLQPSHLGLAGKNNVQMALDLQGRTLSPWATCCRSVGLTVKVCSCAQTEAHVFQCVPLPLVLSLGIPDKSLNPSSLHPHFRWWYVLIRVSLGFLLAKQSLLPHPFLVREVLQSLNPFGWIPSYVCVSKGKDCLCHPAGAACVISLVWGTLLSPMQLQEPRAFFAKGFFQLNCSRMCQCVGLFLHSPFLQPTEVPMDGSRTCRCISHSQFVSPAALLRACSAHHH